MPCRIVKERDVYFVEGSIDETADFSPLLAAVSGPVVLNFERASRINSVGTKKLMELMRDLRVDVEIRELPRFLVDLANSAASFLGPRASSVTSVYTPYVCGSCGRPTEVLIDVRRVTRSSSGLSYRSILCDCRGVMRADPPLEDYLLFLSGGN